METDKNLPERLIGKMNPEAWQEIQEDSRLYYATRREMKAMGLRPPTWIEWIRDWSFLERDAVRKPL